ncbi:hypothetical protein TNCV_3841421 [Trichonephila clavipes]|nr:hypothetical protein TNCV_3841421 [Trichonephila clavipes]
MDCKISKKFEVSRTLENSAHPCSKWFVNTRFGGATFESYLASGKTFGENYIGLSSLVQRNPQCTHYPILAKFYAGQPIPQAT